MRSNFGKWMGMGALAFMLCLAALVMTGTVHADFACDLCGWVVTESENQLTECRNQIVNPHTQEQGDKCTLEDISRSVNGACAQLPEFLTESCNEFITQYDSEVIRLFLTGVPFHEICTEMSLCP